MKINRLFQSDKPLISLEVYTTDKLEKEGRIYKTLTDLAEIHPDFISITCGTYDINPDDMICRVSSYIKNKLMIEPLAHMTCITSSKNEVLIHLNELEQNGIENILALKGDIHTDIPIKKDFAHASDLAQILGKYSKVNIAGVCYPECHFEATSLDEDIKNLGYKLDSGINHLISQVFFDNIKFYRFIDKMHQMGYYVPVEAEIVPITSINLIERIIVLTGASLPTEFTHLMYKYRWDEKSFEKACIEYAVNQCLDLIHHGIDGIHLLTMNNVDATKQVYEGVRAELHR